MTGGKIVKQNCRPTKMNYSKCIILRFTAFIQKISKRLQKEHRLIKVWALFGQILNLRKTTYLNTKV